MSNNPLNQSKWEIEAELRIGQAVANAKRLDAELRTIENRIKQIVNTDLAPKTQQASTFQQARAFLTPENLSRNPALATLAQEHLQRGQALAADAQMGLMNQGLLPRTSNYLAAGSPQHIAAAKQADATLKAQDKLAKSLENAAKQHDELAKRAQKAADEEEKLAKAAQKAAQAEQEQLRRGSFGSQLQQNLTGSRSLAMMGAFASGDMGAVGRTIGMGFAQALLNSRPSSLPLAGGIIRRSGALQGLFGGTPGVPGGIGPAVPAELAGEAGATGESTLGAAVMSNPVTATIAAALAATMGVAAMANIENAKQNTRQEMLRASIGGITGATDLGATKDAWGRGGIRHGGAEQLYNTIFQAGQTYFPGQDPQQVMQVAASMGLQGVTAQQMTGGKGQTSAINVALAAARQTGLDPSVTGNYVGTVMTKGGQSANQVAKSFQDLAVAADKTGIPMNRLLDGMQAITQASGGAAVNVMSLAAAQSVVSGGGMPGINVGQLMAPMMGASGMKAFGMGAMLGVSPGEFTNIQSGGKSGKGGNVGRAMDVVQRFLKQNMQGVPPEIIAGFLQQQGIVDWTGVSNQNQQQMVQKWMTGKQGQFEQPLAQMMKEAAKDKPQTWEDKMANVAQQESSFLQNLQKDLEELKNVLGQLPEILKNFTGAINSLKGVINPLGPELSAFSVAIGPIGPAITAFVDFIKSLPIFGSGHHDPPPPPPPPPDIPHDLAGALKGGMDVPTVGGGHAHLSAATIKTLQGVSQKTGVALPLLIATAAHSGGVGAMHFQLSGPSAAASERYLNQAARQYHLPQATTAAQFKKLAQDLHVESLAAGLRYHDLVRQAHGHWEQAATAYNTGSLGDSLYGQQINTAGGTVNIELHGTIHPDGSVTFPSTTHVVQPKTRPGPQGHNPPAVRVATPPTTRNRRAGHSPAAPTRSHVDPTSTPPAGGSGTHRPIAPPAARSTPVASRQPPPTSTPWAERTPPPPTH